MDPVAMDIDRPMWRGAVACTLAIVGAGSGYGSFFRLPYMFHRFGGGTFLLVYVPLLLLVAWPLSLIELLLGQWSRKGPIAAWEQVSPALHGLGYAMTAFCTVLMAVYFSSVLTWVLRPYLMGSAQNPLAYAYAASDVESMQEYFFENALFNNFGSNWPLLVTLLGVWLLVFFIALKGVSSASIAVYVTVPVPLVAAVALTIYSLTIPGAVEALRETMTPGGWRSFFHLDLWAHAFGHALLTLQSASGVLVSFGSFAKPVHNCVKISVASLVQAIVFAATFALLAGASFAVFLPSRETSAPFYGNGTDVWARHYAEAGSAVGSESSSPPSPTLAPFVPAPKAVPTLRETGLFVPFVTFPALFAKMPWGNGWGVMFYVVVVALGIQSLSAAAQSVFTVVKDRFSYKHNALLLAILCVCGCAFALLLTLRGGYPYLMALDTAVVSIILPLFALMECIGVGYLWADRSIADVASERGGKGCLGRAKALLVVAYHHSVIKIQDLLLQQGHQYQCLTRVLPFWIKFLASLLSLVALVAGLIEIHAQPTTQEIVLVAALPALTVLMIVVFGCLKRQKRLQRTFAPLTDDDIALATSADHDRHAASATSAPLPPPVHTRSESGMFVGSSSSVNVPPKPGTVYIVSHDSALET